MGTFVARCGRSDKVFTPVLGAVLLVALTALLASTLGAYGLGAGFVEPGPHVAVDGEPVVAYDHDDGDREQRLRLVHEGGTPVPVSELELIVTVPRTGDRARMGGFPVASNKLDPAQVTGASSSTPATARRSAVSRTARRTVTASGGQATDSACASTAVWCDSPRAPPLSSAWSTRGADRWWQRRR